MKKRVIHYFEINIFDFIIIRCRNKWICTAYTLLITPRQQVVIACLKIERECIGDIEGKLYRANGM